MTEAPSTKPRSVCGAGEVKRLPACVAVFWPSERRLDTLPFRLPAPLPGAWSCQPPGNGSGSRASDFPENQEC